MHLTAVSITGADDNVDPAKLPALSLKYPLAEWAILYLYEKEGAPRYPTALWRSRFLAENLPRTAAHLCGTGVFRALLDASQAPPLLAELSRFHRIQININAVREEFTPTEVRSVYDGLLRAGMHLILQYHAGTSQLIDEYISTLDGSTRLRVDVLFDQSKGKGASPDSWPAPLEAAHGATLCGYAGGLGPNNLATELQAISAAVEDPRTEFWVDMETGVRSGDNDFDISKAERALAIATTAKARHELR